MPIITGLWRFRDDLSSYTLNQNVSYVFTDEYFESNNGQKFTYISFEKDQSNKLTLIEYGGFNAYLNGVWTNEAYQYIYFGTGVTVSQDVYDIITDEAQQVSSFNVVFRNSDNTILSTQSVTYGGFATRPAIDPTYPGVDPDNKYEFRGWSSDENNYVVFNFTTPIYSDTTIYAWYKIKPLVTFYSYNELYLQEYVETGDTITPPADPTPQGTDIFSYWVDSNNQQFDFDTPITEDLNLYALYSHVYEVKFYNQGVQYGETQQVREGNLATRPAINPTSQDELDFFTNWSVYEDEYLEFDFNTPIEENTNIYAWYDKGNYVYFMNEGVQYQRQIIAPNSHATRPVTDPTSRKPNRDFRGWSSVDNDYVKYNFNTIIIETTYIYAYYEIETYESTMSFNYSNYLFLKLEEIKHQLEIDNDILIGDERIFENGRVERGTILVVIKYLQVSYEFNAKTQPVQITVLTEDNTFENAKLLFKTFTERYNWTNINAENAPNLIDGTQFIKQQYSSPVSINNFAETDEGFRMILLVDANLFIMDNILDVNNLKINDVSIKPLTFSMNYSMSGNTQQFPNNYISQTVKSASTFAVTMSLPMINYNGETIIEHRITQIELTYGYFNIYKSNLPVYIKNLIKVELARNDARMSFEEFEDYYKITILQGTNVDDIVELNFEYYLVNHILQILKGISTGNDNFKLDFEIGEVIFSKNMKLVAFQFNTNPEQIPGFTLNFLE